jgi:hypothetical protein
MREIRIKLPDLKDGRRLLGAAKERIEAIDTDEFRKSAISAAERFTEQAQNVEPPKLWQAHRLEHYARSQLSTAHGSLQDQHELTAQAMQDLGEIELGCYGGSLREFVDLFEKLRNVTLSELDLSDVPPEIADFDVEVRDIDFDAVDAARLAVSSGAAGAAGGLIAFAAVGTFATASTGTAIGALSGAAATNATLAWLGGGAIAAGGGGMAAGAMVLGGIVAIPVLAVGGMALRHKGRKALAEAEEDALKAERAIEDMELAATMARGIELRAARLAQLTERLDLLLRERNAVLRHITARSVDYAAFDVADRDAVMHAASTAKTLRTVMDVPLLDDDGTVTSDSAEVAEAAANYLDEQEQDG